MEIFERINGIRGKDDFVQFLKDLSVDYTKHHEQWANTSIPVFLEQMASWVEDYSSCPDNDFPWEEVDFRVLAAILYMGKSYE